MSITITRTAWTDDDGTGTTGTVINNAEKTTLYGQIDALFNGTSAFFLGGALGLGTYTTTTTGTKNDWDIDTDNSGTTVGILRCNNATALTITGFKAPATGGRLLLIQSIGAGQVDLSHQDTGSTTAGDRLINFATVGKTSLAAGVGTALYQYDLTTARWRLVQHEQGEFIDYSGTSTITGWSSRTTSLILYKLNGRQLSVIWQLAGTSNATTVSFTLPYTSRNTGGGWQDVSSGGTDNGVTLTTAGLKSIPQNSATVSVFKDPQGSAWTNSGTKATNATFLINVQ